MQCSWKMILVLTIVYMVIQYTLIQSFSTVTHHFCPRLQPSNLLQPQEHPHSFNSGQKQHILILAAGRSGSSFFGELFNQHPDVFYLYEPLYHIFKTFDSTLEIHRRMLLGASRDLLRSLFLCDLHALEAYITPQPQDHVTDHLNRRGASRALCTPPLCDSFDPDSWGITEVECRQTCRSLNLTLASQSCQQRGAVVIKTIRIPGVSHIQDLLTDPRLNLKVIQLVRDPRGVLASRMLAFPRGYPLLRLWKMKHRKPEALNFTQEAVCEDFLSSVTTALSQPAWLRGRYMLLRYEDLARHTLQTIQEVFRPLGLSVDGNILDWIEENTNGNNDESVMDPFGTKRDSATNSESWRLKLSFDMVEYVQTLCKTTLNQLGYKIVNSSTELTNASLSLVEDRAWKSFQ